MAKEIEGLAQVVANLRALPAAIAGKNGGPLRVALAKAAKVIRDEARARVPIDDREGRVGKHLREEIVMKRDPNPRATDNAAERYIVTVKYKAKKYANTAANRRAGRTGKTYQNFGDFYYWRFLEFGSSTTGPPVGFMRKAFESNKESLAGMVRDDLAAAIAAAVRSMRS
jgi:HK97 gp10 family phage protein